MHSGWKVLSSSPFQKLTIFASSLALLSGCALKNPLETEVKAESSKQPSHQSKTENSENKADAEKPNFIYIVLDDSGFSDLATFGSEIQTPNLDHLAENGIRYNNFHVTPVCSPTRASLLTGRNPHDVGMATVANFDMGPDLPNKRGRIKPEAGTVAEVLKENDYSTFALGKWHLSPSHQATAAGPYENWPLAKGFDRFYGFLEDSSDQYKPELVKDNSFIETPEDEDYHFSEDIVNQANQYVTDHASIDPDKPFFMYLAFGAQHQPVQVPEKYIDMYDGKYDEGWDKIREERFERQKELGIIPENTKLAPLNPGVKPWNELSEDEKEAFTRFQETYAGFLTHTDEQIGRLVDQLEAVDELEDTMIVFLSDNGASSMGKATGSINHTLAYNDIPESLTDIVDRVDDIGSDKTKSEFPAGWAQVSGTPFKLYKSTMYGAGVKSPLIISYPKGLKDKGAVRNQFAHAIDVTPTIYDLAGIELPKEIKGVKQMPLQGESFAETFEDDEVSTRDTQYFENNGQRAIYSEGWKAIAKHVPKTPYEKDVWELYHVAEDVSESKNLAADNPKKLKELQKLFDKEAKKYGVMPMSDIMGDGFLKIPEDSLRAKNQFTFYPGMSRLPEGAAPLIINRSYSITVPIIRKNENDEGVLLALGSSESGYTLYIKDNKLIYEYNRGNAVYKIESNQEVPVGISTVSFEFEHTAPHQGNGKLYINKEAVGETNIEETHKFKLSFEGLDIGKDSNYPVSKNYKDEDFDFTGEIDKVIYDIK
ncbi:arylsulfatase [Planococcus shenhongbingii]|uniref:Arylsulfatase n=1 Tax=Planococcus shenhongbingii TaxID=3058398 RepID=A0ABT8NH19_9BACL|nr:arylsulfatase [Planococcus sp. N017]MDN7247058.1 arylsulfatase [Planococcus sp. N017]